MKAKVTTLSKKEVNELVKQVDLLESEGIEAVADLLSDELGRPPEFYQQAVREGKLDEI